MWSVLNGIGDFLAGAQAMAVYWALAIGGTALFALMGILSLFGIGSMGGADADVDVNGDFSLEHMDTGYTDFRLLSIRSVLAFFTVVGWGGVVWGGYGWFGFFLAFASGLAMMFVTALIFCLILRMQQSGNVAKEDFIGKTGTVYVGIPGGRNNPGKVTVTVGAATHEVLAVADEAIPTGSAVVVLESAGERRFLVRKL